MEPQRPTGQAKIGMDREALEGDLLSVKLSLTAAWAHAQLLERRSRRGAPATPAQTERAVGIIASACEAMTRRIREIEDALNQQGDATDAANR